MTEGHREGVVFTPFLALSAHGSINRLNDVDLWARPTWRLNHWRRNREEVVDLLRLLESGPYESRLFLSNYYLLKSHAPPRSGAGVSFLRPRHSPRRRIRAARFLGGSRIAMMGDT